MKILIASTPATGHLNPLLAIARLLVAEAHEIAFLTGSAFRARIEAAGASSLPFLRARTSSCGTFLSVAPELKDIAPGLESLRCDLQSVFSSMPSLRNTRGLCETLQHFDADICRRRHAVRGPADAA